jgi:hypothetical protein
MGNRDDCDVQVRGIAGGDHQGQSDGLIFGFGMLDAFTVFWR